MPTIRDWCSASASNNDSSPAGAEKYFNTKSTKDTKRECALCAQLSFVLFVLKCLGNLAEHTGLFPDQYL
jgi:hypothetical protein